MGCAGQGLWTTEAAQTREHGLERMGSLEVLMEPGEGHWKQRDMAITATRTPSSREFARSCSSSYSRPLSALVRSA